MVKLTLVIAALVCTLSSAFVPRQPAFRTTTASSTSTTCRQALADQVDTVGNNVAVKNLLTKVEDQQLLSQVAASGLLSKAQKAGITLSKLEPLLALAADNPDILILVEASGPEVLPLLPTVVDVAPAALPLLASAVSVPPALIGGAGIAALAAAAAAVSTIPDDSVASVALQTLIVGLSVPLAVASFGGAFVLGQLTK